MSRTMTAEDLVAALQELSTVRLQSLVDRLEREPQVRLTVGTWWPQCPMVLAGFDPRRASRKAPEHRFAQVWDEFALPRPTRGFPTPRIGRQASRRDVQMLLRAANGVLAARSRDAGTTSPTAPSHEHVRTREGWLR